ncbi:MAG: ROK family protein [Polyangiaceae bacterium]|nr:ROK family protein [Myxococcales bacterium]MCB9584471.1 ROK family protein [Polyangiaceae bacterium]MCB9609314.1 ROK family protein [Polyangiaceae bacterium]
MSNIGVDMGGTRIKAGIVEGARILRSETVDTNAGASPSDVLDAVARAVRALTTTPTRVGFAIPGEVDGTGACWQLPNVPGFAGVNIQQELERRVGCPVVVENDATVAALGEALHGWGAEYPSFLMVTLGTGVGGGLVLDGKLRRGSHGFAGEIGHLQIDRSPSAPKDAAGLAGTLEAYAGTHALLAKFRELGGEGSEVLHIAESARRGETAGCKTFEMMGEALGEALNGIQVVLDLDAIVFTGGISRSFDLVEPSIRSAMRRRAYAEPLVSVPLLQSKLGDAAGLVGAAHLVDA